MTINEVTPLEQNKKKEESIILAVWKLTALWAFSEAALGGVLHAFRMPFRGMIIGGAASILISLIAYFSKSRGSILNATVLVIIVKGIVSPHTPPAAYFAVFVQGLMGEIFFFNKKFFKTSAVLLTVLSLLLSATQKLVILTIVFGNTLWESIDQFISFITNQFLGQEGSINASYLIVGSYLGFHILIGILVGLFAGKLPFQIDKVVLDNKIDVHNFNESINESVNLTKRKRKHWWQRPSGIIFIIFLVILVVLSYTHPEFGEDKTMEILIMILRAILIITIWYFFIAPIVLKYLRKILKKKQNQYISEISKIVEYFPHLKSLVFYCWKESSESKGYKRIKYFVVNVFAHLLISDFTNYSK